jgi:hypothetical protein
MSTIHVEIVSAEREIFSGDVEIVFAPARLGEVGILPGHAAMLTPLRPGEVRVQMVGGEWPIHPMHVVQTVRSEWAAHSMARSILRFVAEFQDGITLSCGPDPQA